jgi:hypothetical protein
MSQAATERMGGNISQQFFHSSDTISLSKIAKNPMRLVLRNF